MVAGELLSVGQYGDAICFMHLGLMCQARAAVPSPRRFVGAAQTQACCGNMRGAGAGGWAGGSMATQKQTGATAVGVMPHK